MDAYGVLMVYVVWPSIVSELFPSTVIVFAEPAASLITYNLPLPADDAAGRVKVNAALEGSH
tara:strand:- start:22 stop:207 length:186 start_codon:yes stop_codon:yes gene_type:complete